MSTILPFVAFLSNFLLLALVRRHRRAAIYCASLLASDVVRLAFQQIPLHLDDSVRDLALYAVDGSLALVVPVFLVWALRLDRLAMAGLSVVALFVGLYETEEGRTDQAGAVYVSALMTAHLYASAGAWLGRPKTREVDVEWSVLAGLSLTGATGAVVAVAWDAWDLVNVGNIVAHCALAVFVLFVNRRQSVRK